MSEASERPAPSSGAGKARSFAPARTSWSSLLPRSARFRPRFPSRSRTGGTETWLEIGFGGGEHLAAQARAHRDVNFLGCEPFVNGMAKLSGRDRARASRQCPRLGRRRHRLLPTLPDGSFDRVYILYPDPWPKRRQRKRRLVSDEMLETLARVMKPGAELRFASDIDDYIGWVLPRALRSPHFRWKAARADDWRRPYEGWPGTRYEAKAIREGRVPSYLTFVRI